GRLELVHQPAVEVETFRIRRARAGGEDARPGDRKAVSLRTDRLHDRDVFLVPVIVVVRDVSGVIVLYMSRLVHVRVPDRRALAALVPGALDLVRGCSDAPVKALRKFA